MMFIGSEALRIRGIDPGRRSLDVDMIGTFDDLSMLTSKLRQLGEILSIPLSPNKTVLKSADDTFILEFEIAWSGSPASELLERVEAGEGQAGGCRHTPFVGIAVAVPTLDHLYTLKMSHRYLKDSPHFRKTRSDIMLMRKNGAKIFDQTWLKRREDETYWYRHPKLNVKKGDFFKGDGVKYVYDHDDIHKAVAHVRHPEGEAVLGKFANPVPAYTLYKKDGEQVQCSKEKFFALPEYVRYYGVLEEAYVLALERSQIPFRGKVTPRRSFDIALQKVCTSITSGWFREFAWEYLEIVEALYDESYVARFWKAVDDGLVKDYDPGKAAY